MTTLDGLLFTLQEKETQLASISPKVSSYGVLKGEIEELERRIDVLHNGKGEVDYKLKKLNEKREKRNAGGRDDDHAARGK